MQTHTPSHPVTETQGNPMAEQRPVNLFISYSRHDEALRERLEAHLKLLQRQNVINTWYDRKIDADNDWQNQIDENLESADIILLLISADFLASDYCLSKEIKRTMQRHEEKSAIVVPVLLRPCDFIDIDFMKLQGLPKDLKPVTSWNDQDEAFTHIAKGIRKVAEKVLKPIQSQEHITSTSDFKAPQKNKSGLQSSGTSITDLSLLSFYLENFRVFKKLQVKRLSRVNLVVGRNNVGKSAFLEGIYIYTSKASPFVFHELMRSRQEHWEPENLDKTKGFSLSPFRHFFNGHRIPSIDSAGFKLAIDENILPLHVKTAAYISEKTDEGLTRKKLIDTEETENIDSEIEVFVVSEQEKNTQLLFSEERGWDFGRRLMFNRGRSNALDAIQMVPTQGIPDRKAAQLWDAINLTDLANKVINGLKLIEPSLQGLAFVESNASPREDRVPLVKLQGQEERISLKSLGDGVSRVFHIMLALVNAQNGILLIDEFENGLHWKVQESVWRVLFQMAARLNVQVFCTTHSRDCINAFNTIWHEFENDGAFFRLYSRNDQIQVREYDLEALSASIETDVEVR